MVTSYYSVTEVPFRVCCVCNNILVTLTNYIDCADDRDNLVAVCHHSFDLVLNTSLLVEVPTFLLVRTCSASCLL